MDRREREQILREGGVHEPTPIERADERRLAADLEGSPLVGKPLDSRLRNFRPAADSYIVALGGPLPYMRRLREIDEETAVHEEQLAAAWIELAAASRGDGDAFARGWRATAAAWNFAAVNELIDRHNRYYPVEARLPMDPKTGDYVNVGGRPYKRRPLDAAWVLERFPPVLARVAA